MLNELRAILLNNSSFPDESKVDNPEIKEALIKFGKEMKPNRSMKIDIKTVHGFLRRHKFFATYRWYLGAFQKMSARLIIIEGADAVGKTSLTVPLSEKLGAMPIDNQAVNMFYEMFELPRIYKMAVADYNDNIAIGLLFYMCVNIFALEKAYKAFESGYKYAVIDSSLLRTLSARIAIPVAGTDNELFIDQGIYDLVKNQAGQVLPQRREEPQAVFVLCLHVCERRRADVPGRGRRAEFLRCETNRSTQSSSSST